LQASSSGHSAAATIHSASIDQVFNRIESIAFAASADARQVVNLARNTIRWLVHISVASSHRTLEIRRNE
jgi:type IV secretory pathway ATPase VirB11/archaellum biosynthesis ATPase